MNERIRELVEQARNYALDEKRIYERMHNTEQCMEEYREVYNKKFAELIVQECIKTIEYRAPGQMGKEGEGWTNGYDDGLKTGAWLLKEHFGIQE
jgi:hypothetical protein